MITGPSQKIEYQKGGKGHGLYQKESEQTMNAGTIVSKAKDIFSSSLKKYHNLWPWQGIRES